MLTGAPLWYLRVHHVWSPHGGPLHWSLLISKPDQQAATNGVLKTIQLITGVVCTLGTYVTRICHT